MLFLSFPMLVSNWFRSVAARLLVPTLVQLSICCDAVGDSKVEADMLLDAVIAFQLGAAVDFQLLSAAVDLI